jgi:hypothetical protein
VSTIASLCVATPCRDAKRNHDRAMLVWPALSSRAETTLLHHIGSLPANVLTPGEASRRNLRAQGAQKCIPSAGLEYLWLRDRLNLGRSSLRLSIDCAQRG